ncbi:MAG: amidohydrolase family protein [Acidimicrobiales bacterium]
MTSRGPLRIDTHHHIVPPEYAAWLRANDQQAGGLPIPVWSVDDALAAMDASGVATAVLSVSTPGTHIGGGSDAAAMARAVNDYAADVAAGRPDRFGFFASLPLPDVDAALAEIERALDDLGADGIVVLANHRGVYLGDRRFDPIFDELQRRRAVVFVHPSILPGADLVPGIPPFVADFLLDTTRAAVNLCRRGTIQRCPDVRFILSHAGGFVPYAAHRIALAASPSGEAVEGLDLLGRFYFDTALSASPTALPSLLAFARPGHVLFGSDWPYAPAPVVSAFVAGLEAHPLDDEQRRSIDRGAAEALFPHRVASVEPPS